MATKVPYPRGQKGSPMKKNTYPPAAPQKMKSITGSPPRVGTKGGIVGSPPRQKFTTETPRANPAFGPKMTGKLAR